MRKESGKLNVPRIVALENQFMPIERTPCGKEIEDNDALVKT